jgi:hypothetical protein
MCAVHEQLVLGNVRHCALIEPRNEALHLVEGCQNVLISSGSRG